MGVDWKKRAQYLQNVSTTVFAQCRINLSDLQRARKVSLETTPQQFWEMFGEEIKIHLMRTKGFESKTLGAIIGAGHSDYSGPKWVLFEDCVPSGYQIQSDTVLVELAAMSIVAAQWNYFRNNRPYPHVNWD